MVLVYTNIEVQNNSLRHSSYKVEIKVKESVIALIITLLLDRIRLYRLYMCLLLIIVKFGTPAVTKCWETLINPLGNLNNSL